MANGIKALKFFQVSPGKYSIQALSEDGCIFNHSSHLIQKSEKLVIASLAVLDPTTCQDANGNIAATLSNNPGYFSLDEGETWHSQGHFNELSIGAYTLQFRNETGTCQDSVKITLTAGDTLTRVDTVEILQPSCFGSDDGYIHLSIKQDTGQYQWQWSFGQSGNQLGRLGAGDYTVEIHSNPFCQIRKSISLTAPQPISFVVPRVDTMIYCQGQSIPIALENSDYTYEWYQNDLFLSTGPSIVINEQGDYRISARDTNGCSTSKQLSVHYSDEIFHANFLLSAMAVIGQPTNAVEISWPVPDEIFWEIEFGQITDTYLNQSMLLFDSLGEHRVILRAKKGDCVSVVEKSIIVVESADQLNYTPSAHESELRVSLFPNPNLGNFNVVIEPKEVSDIQLRIYNEQAQLVYSDMESSVKIYSKNIDLTNSLPGIYTLIVQSHSTWKAVSFILE